MTKNTLLSFRASWGIVPLLSLDSPGEPERMGLTMTTRKSGITLTGERAALERFQLACRAARHYCQPQAERTAMAAFKAAQKVLDN
jgi:hypothetical protein